MPRSENDAWKEFHVTTDANGRKLSMTCRHCHKNWQKANATRCTEHLPKCPKLPTNLRRAYGFESSQAGDPDDPPEQPRDGAGAENSAAGAGSSSGGRDARGQGTPTVRAASSQGGVGDGPTPPKRPRSGTGTVKSFVDSMSKEENARIDEALARAVFAKGLPLNVFEGEYFAAAFQLMRPSYKNPPSSYRLGHSLLDKEYNVIHGINMEKIKSSDCKGLMLDGCGNVNRENVVNFIVTTPEPVFYTYVLPDDSRETCEFLAGEVRKILIAEGPKTFFLIMTDNAAVMRAMWAVIEQEFPHITGAGCASHCFNLLFQDLVSMPALSRVMTVAKRIIKSIRNSYVNLNTFRKKQKEKYGNICTQLKLPPKTRWAFSVIMLNSLMKNKAAVQETIVNEDLVFDNDVRAWALDNVKFWERVKLALDMLKPLHAAITIVESNKALLSDVFFLQKKYSSSVTSNLRALRFKRNHRVQVRNILSNREEFTIKTIHKTTFLLDPRYRDLESMLSSDDVIDCLDYIGKLCEVLELNEGQVIASLGEYRTRTGFFARPAVWAAAQRTEPRVWWRGVSSGEAIAPIAWRLLSLPPTSAECERDWSTRNHIHSKSRNRLKNEKVKKLSACKKGLTKKVTKGSPFFTVEEMCSYMDTYLDPTPRDGDEGESEESGGDDDSDEDDSSSEEGGNLDSDWSERDAASDSEEEEAAEDANGEEPRNRQATPPVRPARSAREHQPTSRPTRNLRSRK